MRAKKGSPALRRRRPARRAACFLIGMLVLCWLFFRLEAQVRPILVTVVQYESKRYALSAFNDAVARNIAANPDEYQDLYSVVYSDDGSIAAVQTDTYAMNKLSSDLVEALETRLDQLDSRTMDIPLGTLLGVQMLAGRGPVLHMKILPESFVSARVYDRLESAGINQTALGVYVHFSMNMSVILSGYSTTAAVENDICLSQMLLVGDAPQAYWGQWEK